jgi:hypothetical protein
MMLREAGNWLLVLLTVVWCVFTLIYALRSKWWTNEVGRVILPEKVLTCLVLVQVAASAMSNSLYPGRDVIRIVLYAGCAVSVLVLTVVLVRIQRRERRGCPIDRSDC